MAGHNTLTPQEKIFVHKKLLSNNTQKNRKILTITITQKSYNKKINYKLSFFVFVVDHSRR